MSAINLNRLFCKLLCLSQVVLIFPTFSQDFGLASPAEISQANVLTSHLKESPDQDADSQEVKADSFATETGAKPEARKTPILPSLVRISELEPTLFKGFDLLNLKRFGDDLFVKRDSTSLELSPGEIQVPDSYQLGIGDEIQVHFWNQTQNEVFRAMVTPGGRIAFPLAGEILVSGIKVGELREHLLQELKKFYTEIDLSFHILRLRRFPVFITGESQTPGMRAVNALFSPIRLLMLTGGPNSRGSFRTIRLVRGGELEKNIDLYNLLSEGRVDANIRFQPDDVLHIPLAESRVALLGSVKRPGIYELKEGETMSTLLKFGGGLEGGADQNLLQLLRIDEKGRFLIQDLDPSRAKEINMGDGDVVIGRSLKRPIFNKVSVEGYVFHPGVFQWVDGMSVKDLISKAQGLPADAYLKRANLYRPLTKKSVFQLNKALEIESAEEIIEINLAAELDSTSRTLVHSGDRLVVYSLADVQNMPQVEVVGAVNHPGKFPLYGGSRVSDILFHAQLNEASYMLRAQIHRRDEQGLRVLTFDPQKAMKRIVEENLTLENGDIISIFRDPDLRDQGRVFLRGLVQFPGTYPFQRGERLYDVLKRAQGINEDGYLKGAIFTRESVLRRQLKTREEYSKQEEARLETMKLEVTQSETEEKDRERSLSGIEQVQNLVEKFKKVNLIGRIQLDFSKVVKIDDLEDSEVNILLEDGDSFEVPPRPSEVTVLGQVYSPGTLLFQQNKSVRDYLTLAGGFTEFAYEAQAYVLKADGSARPVHKLRSSKNSLLYIGGVGKSQRGVSSLGIDPGDTIIVPARLRIQSDRFEKSLDAVYKTAVSVGALGGLFK